MASLSLPEDALFWPRGASNAAIMSREVNLLYTSR
jgi:hypothetical protein